MNKIFLVMKDPEAGPAEDNWTTMTMREFLQFKETEEGQRRKDNFARLDAIGVDDDILFVECSPEKVREIKRERNHSDYLRRMEEESGYRTVSLDAPVHTGDAGHVMTLHDLVADENVDTVEEAMTQVCLAELPGALDTLTTVERELVSAFYLSEVEISERRFAQVHGMTRFAVRECHRTAMGKLRWYFRKKKLL